MKLVGREILHDFSKNHADVKSQLEAFEQEIIDADWDNPHDLLAKYPTADPLGKGFVIINIKGNHYRVEMYVNYQAKSVVISRIDTHSEYSRWK